MFVSLPVTLDQRTSKVHQTADDGENRIAATPADTLGLPAGVVVEPPRLVQGTSARHAEEHIGDAAPGKALARLRQASDTITALTSSVVRIGQGPDP
jgi:hypothetical protein